MIIHEPELAEDGDQVVVSARVEFGRDIGPLPDRLWWSFPATQAGRISLRADGFVSAMVLMAMRWNEPIEVRGELSPRLLAGLGRFQETFHSWSPGIYHRVDIDARWLVEAPAVDADGDVLSSFSGGVDSLHTLRSHLPEADRAEPSITHGLFILGADIPVEESRTYTEAAAVYDSMFQRLGLGLLRAGTNHHDFGSRPHWGMVHGPVLIGTAQVLGRGARRFYVPASFTPETLLPWGSDPRVDPLLSTEALEIVHDGMLNRTAKTIAIADWEESRTSLRVCDALSGSGIRNCSRCAKCLLAMAVIEIVADIEDFVTFEKIDLGPALRGADCRGPARMLAARELIGFAAAHHRWDIAGNVTWAWVRSLGLAELQRLARRLRRITARRSLHRVPRR